MPTEFESDDYRLPINIEESDDAVWNLLSLYADGEATPDEAVQVEALLCSDPRLARDLQFLRTTGETVQTFAEIEPPADLRDAIFAATSRRQTVLTRVLAFCGEVRQAFAPRSRYALTLGGVAAASLLAAALWPSSQPLSLSTQNTPDAKIASNPPVTSSQEPVVPPKATSRHTNDLLKPAKLARATKSPEQAESAPRIISVKNLAAPPVRSNPLALHPGTGKPKSSDQNRPSTTSAGGYEGSPVNIQPDNDAHDRHMASHTAPPAPITSMVDDTSMKPDPAGNPTALATREPMRERDPRPEAKVMVAKLPPEAYQFLTNAQMKKQLDAKSLGYDRDTVKSIQRKELTVSLIKGSL